MDTGWVLLALGLLITALIAVFGITTRVLRKEAGQEDDFLFVENDLNGRAVRTSQGRSIYEGTDF